ncbi:amidase [Marinobacter salexigens]|uniref:Amidase n=1 Tax=Marinobacter salexigens TaxID=1925763 RepID=A0ABS6A5P2_9GAMM|nr:amidase [Marinobacter salexigens]MBU2872558.1 amidase [Marinobacter salexigens]
MDTELTKNKSNRNNENKMLTFYDHVPRFLEGSDSPRAYLERCINTIIKREAEVQAFVSMNLVRARADADASTMRYAAGKPLSLVDGMPIGVKDLFETEDLPTEVGSPLFKGKCTDRDAAVVQGLREAGAIILGKTVTAEFGFYSPGPTRNPLDITRTPGGSSSGSGAAVGAGMVPVAIGTQVVGSLIRPSSFNGNFGFKPTFGAINSSGAHSNLSQSVLGMHAGSLTDAWIASFEAARFAGGDPGHPGLYGIDEPMMSTKPKALARIETAGWQKCSPEVRELFERLVKRIEEKGVNITDRFCDINVESFESSVEPALDITNDICGYEFRWPLSSYQRRGPNAISSNIAQRLERWKSIENETYRNLLQQREKIRSQHERLKDSVTALITLSATGAAPKGLEYTGDPIFAVTSSILGAPAISLPLLEVDGMPLGIQIIGYKHRDAELFGIARWIMSIFDHKV